MIQNRNNQAIVSNFKQPKRVIHRKQVMRTFFLLPVMIAGLCFMLTSGGCSSSTTPAAGTSGASLSDYTIPTELSAVPTKEGVGDQSSLLNLSLKSALKAMTRAATDAGTDYSNAETRKYVEEHSLEQFNMLEVVLNAISQTNYTLEIDNDPYKAMVAFEDDQQIIQTGKFIINKVEKLSNPDGTVKWISVTKVPRYDETGNIIGTAGISRDITEWKKLEDRLKH